jgi:hypothetical protein
MLPDDDDDNTLCLLQSARATAAVSSAAGRNMSGRRRRCFLSVFMQPRTKILGTLTIGDGTTTRNHARSHQ